MNYEPSFKEILESPAYEAKKAALTREINSQRVYIDRSVFRKTKAEKVKLLNLKRKVRNREFTNRISFQF